GTAAFPSYNQQRDRDDYDRSTSDRRGGYGEANGMAPAAVGAHQAEPDYSTFEEAESAFIKLLRRANVQPDGTWEQAMRSVVKDPQARALKDPRGRKAAFEKYAV